MKKNPELSLEQFTAAIEAASKRARMLLYIQIALLVLCIAALISGISITVLIGSSVYTTSLGVIAMLSGLGMMLMGKAALKIHSKMDEIRHTLEHLLITPAKNTKDNLTTKIPLTIGFSNLSGPDLSTIVSEDIAALSPLFERSNVVADHQIPSAEILLVYAHLNEDGTIKDSTTSGIRQVVQLTNAAIVVLASQNAADHIQKAIALPGPKTANIVFTLDRNGSGFDRFFQELFRNMGAGKDMLSAWVELAPQHQSANPLDAPQTILLAEGGKIAFSR
jgi:hypothetical protein